MLKVAVLIKKQVQLPTLLLLSTKESWVCHNLLKKLPGATLEVAALLVLAATLKTIDSSAIFRARSTSSLAQTWKKGFHEIFSWGHNIEENDTRHSCSVSSWRVSYASFTTAAVSGFSLSKGSFTMAITAATAMWLFLPWPPWAGQQR